MSNDRALRNHLLEFLRGGSAHIELASVLKDFPAKLYGTRPEGLPYSGWELLEHIRFALHDLLNFCTNPEYLDPSWPADYWPKSPQPPSDEAWHRSVKAIEEDLDAFEELIQNPKSNLYAEIPWAKDGQTLLREILLATDHTSYHTGQLVLVRRLLGAWNS
jgi:DinB superfamily